MRRAARAACENDVNDTVKERRRQIHLVGSLSPHGHANCAVIFQRRLDDLNVGAREDAAPPRKGSMGGDSMSIRDVAHESDSWWAYKPAPSRRPLGQDPAFRYSMLGQNRPIDKLGLLPRDESVVPEPSCFQVIANTKKSPAFEEEVMRLKRRQVAAQSLSGARVDPRPLRQQVAADGQYLVTKLLGGGPPSPTDGPKPQRGRSMTRLHPPLGESSVRTT